MVEINQPRPAEHREGVTTRDLDDVLFTVTSLQQTGGDIEGLTGILETGDPAAIPVIAAPSSSALDRH